jgi:hypothetical protein
MQTKTPLSWITDQGWTFAAILSSLIALAIGWRMFSARMVDRTQHDDGSAVEVARIWGGPLNQPQPIVEWRRADAATVELARAEIASTRVDVVLDAEYRRRGLVEFPGYEAKLKGEYRFQNPSSASTFIAFRIGLPVERSALMLSDLKLLVDGKEDPARTEYASDKIVWTGEIGGAKAATFTVEYKARGMQRFGYALGGEGQGRPITNFEMAVHVRGVNGDLDYPIGSMAPTAIEPTADGKTLVWKVDRLLTSFDVGVTLPDRHTVTRALQNLIKNAPFFYLLYAAGLVYALASIGRRARALHILGLSAAYFLYFPLATYLTVYIPWAIACLVATLGISVLVVLHASRFVGVLAAMRIAACQILFLAVPAAAYLVPQHTGLILVLAGFCALAALLQALGRASRALEGADRISAPAPQGGLT